MVENSAKDHHELFYYDDPQPTSESLNETPFDSSRFELVQSSDPATNFETNNSNFDLSLTNYHWVLMVLFFLIIKEIWHLLLVIGPKSKYLLRLSHL